MPSLSTIVILAVAAALLLWFVAVLNSLVALRVRVQNAWSEIDVQLKRRHDLIPNLVSAVQGYMTHERSTLEAVTQARSHAVASASGSVADRAQAESISTHVVFVWTCPTTLTRSLPLISNQLPTP